VKLVANLRTATGKELLMQTSLNHFEARLPMPIQLKKQNLLSPALLRDQHFVDAPGEYNRLKCIQKNLRTPTSCPPRTKKAENRVIQWLKVTCLGDGTSTPMMT